MCVYFSFCRTGYWLFWFYFLFFVVFFFDSFCCANGHHTVVYTKSRLGPLMYFLRKWYKLISPHTHQSNKRWMDVFVVVVNLLLFLSSACCHFFLSLFFFFHSYWNTFPEYGICWLLNMAFQKFPYINWHKVLGSNWPDVNMSGQERQREKKKTISCEKKCCCWKLKCGRK